MEIFKEGYTPWSDTLQVIAGETRDIPADLDSVDIPPVTTATLTLQAVPGGTVTVEGENCRLDVRWTVRAGDKRITFRYEGHTCTQTLRLDAGARQSLTCYFEHRLIVQVRTEDGNPISASILINDIEVDRTSDKVYTVTVQKFGYDVITEPQEVTFEPVFEKPPDKKVVFQIRAQ